MPQNSESQIADLIERQEAHESRMNVLLLQAAKKGSSTPAEVITEVREIQAEVLEIGTRITRLQVSASAVDQREHIAAQTHDLSDVSLQLSSSTDQIRRFQQAMFVQLLQFFDSDNEQRRKRQRMTTIFYVSILIMLAIDIAIRFFK